MEQKSSLHCKTLSLLPYRPTNELLVIYFSLTTTSTQILLLEPTYTFMLYCSSIKVHINILEKPICSRVCGMLFYIAKLQDLHSNYILLEPYSSLLLLLKTFSFFLLWLATKDIKIL